MHQNSPSGSWRVASGLLLLLAASFAVAADDKDAIHLTGSSNTTGLNLNDGAGYRWDITSNGLVNDGTKDAYDGGMQLTINTNYSFAWNGPGKISGDGREIEMGPFNAGGINVYRRVYVDDKKGYCRWIDIFENLGGASVNLSLQWYSNTGGSTQEIHTSGGKGQLTEKDWGVVTLSGDNNENPALVHLFASPGSKVRPKFAYKLNDDNLYTTLTVAVPAKKTIAICHIEAQRKPSADAKKFLADFNFGQELDKVPPSLRRLILNMTTGATMTVGKVELTRSDSKDLAVLRNGDEMLGDLTAAAYEVEAPFGKVHLDAGRVLGIVCPDADDATALLALSDGQVVSGKLVSGSITMKLANGSEVSLQADKLASATYRLSKEKPYDITLARPAILLRSGAQLFFDKAALDAAFQSEYGDLKLSADDLAAIQFDTPEGGMHRAIFRNGSVLSGLMKAPTQKLKLDVGPTLTAPMSLIERITFPTAEADRSKLAEATLRNEDVLVGAIADKSLTVVSRSGKVTVAPGDIAEVQFQPESLGQVQIRLRNGTTVSGRLAEQAIKFKIEPGPELSLYAGHITKIVFPPADIPATASSPASKP